MAKQELFVLGRDIRVGDQITHLGHWAIPVTGPMPVVRVVEDDQFYTEYWYNGGYFYRRHNNLYTGYVVLREVDA